MSSTQVTAELDPRTLDANWKNAKRDKPWEFKTTKFQNLDQWQALHDRAPQAVRNQRCPAGPNECKCYYPFIKVTDCASNNVNVCYGPPFNIGTFYEDPKPFKGHNNPWVQDCGGHPTFGCSSVNEDFHVCMQNSYDDTRFNQCCTNYTMPTLEALRYCHPEWYPFSDACITSQTHFLYCLGKDAKTGKARLFVDEKCNRTSDFAKIASGTIRDDAIAEYCKLNNYPQECWCVAPDKAKPGSNVYNDFKLREAFLKLPGRQGDERVATCWSNECLKYGKETVDPTYLLTTDLQFPDCKNQTPTFVCQQIIEVLDTGGSVDIDRNTFQLACGFAPDKKCKVATDCGKLDEWKCQIPAGSTDGICVSTKPTPPGPTPPRPSPTINPLFIGLGLLALLILVFLVIFLVINAGKKRTPAPATTSGYDRLGEIYGDRFYKISDY